MGDTMPSGFIDDGYTLTETIKGTEGECDGFDVTFRPLIRRERWQHYDKVLALGDSAKAEDHDSLSATLISEHLVSWTLKDRDGNQVPITCDMILRLHPDLFDRLSRMIIESWKGTEEAAKN